jgi:hypothetical protein
MIQGFNGADWSILTNIGIAVAIFPLQGLRSDP